jgi:hypothetical protein
MTVAEGISKYVLNLVWVEGVGWDGQTSANQQALIEIIAWIM